MSAFLWNAVYGSNGDCASSRRVLSTICETASSLDDGSGCSLRDSWRVLFLGKDAMLKTYFEHCFSKKNGIEGKIEPVHLRVAQGNGGRQDVQGLQCHSIG